MAQVGIDNPGRFLAEAEGEKWAERKRQAEAAMDPGKAPSLEALARKVGLETWYAYFYRMSSHHTHSTFLSLVLRHLKFGAEGSMVIDAGPKDTEFRILSRTLAEHVIMATEALYSLYDLDVSQKLSELRQQHQQLTAKDVADMKASTMAAAGGAGSPT